MNRRKFLSLAGVCAATSYTGVLSATEPDYDEYGPPNPEEWTLTFEDTFETLDTDVWDFGWGWGRNTSYSPTQMVKENAYNQDEKLRLQGTHENENVLGGGINSKNRVTFGPGSFIEARIRFAERDGFQCAFWAKPNSERWPPEIDVVELIQEGRGREDKVTSRHHLHYSTSTEPGDSSSHRDVGTTYEPGDVLTENFHVYGVEWQRDRIVHYVDGEEIKEWTDETMLAAMQKGAPFYIMFSLNINSNAVENIDEPWGETMTVDWVRLWDDGVPEDTSTHYLWVRSGDGDPATFTFEASGGNVSLEMSESETQYWIGEDGRTGGGTVDGDSPIPGFWFDGEIASFSYTGSIETYVDNKWVDPDDLVNQSLEDSD